MPKSVANAINHNPSVPADDWMHFFHISLVRFDSVQNPQPQFVHFEKEIPLKVLC
jgi:hypothetical protein